MNLKTILVHAQASGALNAGDPLRGMDRKLSTPAAERRPANDLLRRRYRIEPKQNDGVSLQP